MDYGVLRFEFFPSYISFVIVSMGVTEEMLKPFLEGWRLSQILTAKRLFMMDLRILDGLVTKDDWPVSVSVIGLLLNNLP